MNPNYLPALIEAAQSEHHAIRAGAAQKILDHELAEEWPEMVKKCKAKRSDKDLDLLLELMPSLLRLEKLAAWITSADAYRREHGFEQMPAHLVSKTMGKTMVKEVIHHAVETLRSDAAAIVRRAAAEFLRREMEMHARLCGLDGAAEEEEIIHEHVPVLLQVLTTEAEAAVRVELVGLLGWVPIMIPEVTAALEARQGKDAVDEVRSAAKRALRTLRAGGMRDWSKEERRVGMLELCEAWRHAVGDYLRTHSRPRRLQEGVLRVEVADSGILALILDKGDWRILPRMNEMLGPGSVMKIEVEVSAGAKPSRPSPKPAGASPVRNRAQAPAPPAAAPIAFVDLTEKDNLDWLEECT